MKRTLFCAAFLVVLLAFAPLLCLLPVFRTAPSGTDTASGSARSLTAESDAGQQPQAADSDPLPEPEPILVWDTANSELLTLPAQEYLIGAAACEVPYTWPDDAILAQMVACHSWALYQKEQADGSNEGAWFSVNTTQCSGYAPELVLRSRWGTEYPEIRARFEALADQVVHQVLLYDGAPAAACYHAISCGHTEASQNIWVEALPYLQGVDSPWDAYSENYEVTIQYSYRQMYDVLALNLNLDPGTDPAAWFGDPTWNEAGYVASISICGQDFSGVEVRSALSLRSACFSIAYADEMFTITTRGYGHGAGLSQYGAYAMAQGGSTWQQILAYYFPGTELREL